MNDQAHRASHAQLSHGMNCAAYARPQSGDCTCGLQWRIALDTERTMHAAWRKRAEEAEAALAARVARETGPSFTAEETYSIGLSQGELAVVKKDGRTYKDRRIAGQALEVITMLLAKVRSPLQTGAKE